MAYETQCRQCYGRGVWLDAMCRKCNGTGHVKPYRTQISYHDARKDHGWTVDDAKPYPRFGREGFCMVCDSELTGKQKMFCGRKTEWKGGERTLSCPMLVHYRLYKGVSWQKRAIIVRDGCVCRSCGEVFESPLIEGSPNVFPDPSKVALDHIVPLADGGSEAPSNLQILCHSCHELKTVSENIVRGRRPIEHPELGLEVA